MSVIEGRFWHCEISLSSPTTLHPPVNLLLQGASFISSKGSVCNAARLVLLSTILDDNTMPLTQKTVICSLRNFSIKDENPAKQYKLIVEGGSGVVSVHGLLRENICIPVPESVNRAVNFELSSRSNTGDLRSKRYPTLSDFGTYITSLNPSLERIITVKDIEIGEGPAAGVGDKVYLGFVSRFLDGKVHQSSKSGHKSFSFVVGRKQEVMQGFSDSVVGMQSNGKRIIFIPQHLASGSYKNMEPVPKGASLIFTVMLLKLYHKSSL
ncbi:hypothetical protein BJ165DRAFT_1410377 [Panaeolus papilionaceus]|nr:hypothetical protein BJ165DRAFT_1410377 [Panaeolus papilionaceus]